MRAKSQGPEAVKRLKKEYEAQVRSYKNMIEAENQFFEKAKSMEIERHHSAMISLEQNQAERIARIKQCEQSYERQLRELQMKYSAKKKRLKQAHQHEMRLIEEENGAFDEEHEQILEGSPDIFFAEAVVSEVLQLRSERDAKHYRPKKTPPKLKELVDELESHFRLLHTVMNSTEY